MKENPQFRFTKKADKLEKEYLSTQVGLSVGQILVILERLTYEQIQDFIIILEQNCEDWGVTENLFKYFGETMLGFDEEEDDNLKKETKEIIKKLYTKFVKNDPNMD